MTAPDPAAQLRSFGRIKGRPVKPRQARLMETLLPQLAVDLVDPLTGASEEVWLEIGFGGGEHLAAQAVRHPQVRMLGAEPFQNGVASALRHVEEAGVSNVGLHAGDARALLAALADDSLARVFVLFPDPWPKLRHHKRRLMQADTIAELARVLRPGGAVRFATDWKDYAAWTLERMRRSPHFRWSAIKADDWRVAPPDHVTTRYETKQLGDTAPIWLDFVRL